MYNISTAQNNGFEYWKHDSVVVMIEISILCENKYHKYKKTKYSASNREQFYQHHHSDEVITFVCIYEDSKYRQMALIGFDTLITEHGL